MNERKRNYYTVILVIIALLSIFVIAPVVSSTDFHAKSIETLDDKKMLIASVTATMTTVATTLALVPDDSTTPLANQIMNISSYMLIVVGAIILEKILLTLTGFLAFKFMIPIACGLLIAYLFSKKKVWLNLSLKISALGLILFLLVPVSLSVSNFIENNYNDKISELKTAETIIAEDEKENKDGNWLSNIINGIGGKASQIIEKGKQLLSNLIDTVAFFIISTCVIPILILILMLWLVKLFIGVDIPAFSKKCKDKQIEIKKEEQK